MDHTVSSVPAFINKLWLLVEDEDTNDFIEWSTSGASFVVLDQSGFAKTVLPLFFKHNNMASFVRQLNMYGFRKVSYPEQGGMKYEGDSIEFHHPYFQKGKIKLLDQIKRKGTSKEEIKIKTNDVNKVLNEVQDLKVKQEDIDSRLISMKRENEGLWQEVMTLRQKHRKQQQVVHRLIQFLMSIIPQRPVKRKRPLMIQDSALSPKHRKQVPSYETASSSSSSALQPTSTAAHKLMLSQILGPLDDSSSQVNVTGTDDVVLPAVEGPAATLTELPEPIVQSPSEFQDIDNLVVQNSNAIAEIEQEEPLGFLRDIPLQPSISISSNGEDKQNSVLISALALQRPLSVDEHKQELSEHVENVQSNIEYIHDMLTNGQYSLDPDSLLPVFYPEPFDHQDFLSKLTNMPEVPEQEPSSTTGNELVQYQPVNQFSLTIDDDSLLSTLLGTDNAILVDEGTSKEDELALQ